MKHEFINFSLFLKKTRDLSSEKESLNLDLLKNLQYFSVLNMTLVRLEINILYKYFRVFIHEIIFHL